MNYLREFLILIFVLNQIDLVYSNNITKTKRVLGKNQKCNFGYSGDDCKTGKQKLGLIILLYLFW